MLSEPILTEASNQEALDLLLYSPHAYNQMVLGCVAASVQVQGDPTLSILSLFLTLDYNAFK